MQESNEKKVAQEQYSEQPKRPSQKRVEDSGNNTKLFYITTVIIVVTVALGVGAYMYMTGYDFGPDISPEEQEEQFVRSIQEGGSLLSKGQTQEAIEQFDRAAQDARTASQEGQALLNLGVARLETNRTAAVEILKSISTNESYMDITRAKAFNYVLNEYTATGDEGFARAYIFTGPTWGGFLENAETLDEAVLRGFEHSTLVYSTPEAEMRVARNLAKQLLSSDISDEEKDQIAQQVLDRIEQGDQSIRSLQEEGRVQYGDTHFTEIALAHNQKGLALDILYFEGYIDDPSRVEEAYQDGINAILENRSAGTQTGIGTEFFIRYQLADFLVRLEADREEGIQKVLTPMTELTADFNLFRFLRQRLANAEELNEQLDVTARFRPDNIVRIASISSEFRNALTRLGISDETLNPEQ